jgi:hypothetical protein
MRAAIVGALFTLTALAGRATAQNPGGAPGADQIQRDEEALKAAGRSLAVPDLMALIERQNGKAIDPKRLAELIRALGSADFKEREKATKAILACGATAVPALRAALKSEDAEIVRRAGECLRQIEVEKPLVLAAVRVAVWRQPIEGLRKALRSKDAEVRCAGVDALDSLGTKAADAVPLLLDALDDPDRRTVQHIQATTAGIIRRDQLPLLLAAAKDKRPAVRAGAIGLFAYERIAAEGKAAYPLILEALHDKDRLVRQNAAWSLWRFGSEKETVPALLAALQDQAVRQDPADTSVAEAAASCLGTLGGRARPAIPALIKLAQTARKDLRNSAIQSLAGIAKADDECLREIVPVLTGLLRDKEDFLGRRCAAVTLAQMRVKAAKAVPDLLQALDATDIKDPVLAKQIRINVMAALWGIGPAAADAVPALIRIVQSKEADGDERSQALVTLGGIGPAAKAAIPALRKLSLDGADRATQWQAQQVLKQIEP